MDTRLHGWDMLAIIAAITATCLPFLLSGNALSLNDDWLQLASRHALLRQSLFQDFQFPLRTPFFMGGYPSIADPEDPCLNPLALLTVCFGEVMGLKLIAFTMYLAAGLGMYYLTRRCLGFGRTGALFASLAFGLCGWMPARHAGGNVNEMYFTLTPLILALVLESKTQKGRIVLLALIQAVILTDGKLVWPSIALFIVLLCVLEGVRISRGEVSADGECLRNFAVSAALALLL
ncbi:MAG: hypothetical protein FJ278_22185, partial [Planctomycetes bacterium]|nr:hypothetical protein [Planctomycetota bacterium]